MAKQIVERDMSKWTCKKCGTVNTEYFPWPVNAECENCGHGQVFGVDDDHKDEVSNG